MNFYRRFPGDYARDTKHLTLTEHGAYTLLLDYYYSTERPIPSLEFAFALCNAHQPNTKKAVRRVLKNFFKKSIGGYKNKRAEEELHHLNSKRESAKNSAKARWGTSERNSKRNANASETQYGNRTSSHRVRNALQTLDSRHQTSQDQAAVVGFKGNGDAAAAAFSAIGFPEPFGHPRFQEVFLEEWRHSRDEWLTIKLERIAQRCQSEGIGIPPQFFDAKRDIEARENAEVKRKPPL